MLRKITTPSRPEFGGLPADETKAASMMASPLSIDPQEFSVVRYFAALLSATLLLPVCWAEDAIFIPALESAVEEWLFRDEDIQQSDFTTLDAIDGLQTEAPVRRFKKRAIQRVSVSGGWMAATAGDDLSSGQLEASIGLGVPLGNFDNILGVTPAFRVDWIDAAPALEIPDELYETGVQFFWRKPLNERWSAMAIVGPAYRGDFTTSRRAFRVFGLGLLSWEFRPELLSLSFGAVYLDRADIPLLPAVGLMWTPNPVTRLDIRFPESRFSYRFQKNGSASETWAYLSGGIGGNTWAVTRPSGQPDEVSLRDWRLVAGVEQIVDGGGGWLVEAGYAFNRRLEYESSSGETSLSDGVLLQAGWSY